MIKPLATLATDRERKTFLSPQTFDFLVIDVPAFNAQQLRDFAMTVSSVLFGKPDQRQAQAFIIVFRFCLVPLRRPRHADRLAGPPF